MFATLTRGVLLFALLVALAGCAQTATKETNDGPCPLCAAAQDASTREDGCGCCESDEKPRPDVTLKAVTLDQVAEVIASHEGKVVVVELWASSCAPCLKTLPQLVQLHQTYGPDGLVCVSVSVDSDQDADKALTFLTKQHATFANYRLDDSSADWRGQWKVTSVPALLVYGRDGKQAGKFGGELFSHDEQVVPLVRRLLRAK